MSLRSVAPALALGCFLTGCAVGRPGPVDAILAYTTALRDARLLDAYRMLSAETRRALRYEDFVRLARAEPDEVRQTIRWLEQIDPSAPVTARMELPSGEVLTLVQEGGEWRFDPTVLDFYGQHTPRQALRSFVRALERHRYDILLRFVPRHLAQGMTAETLRQTWGGAESAGVEQMLTQLRRALDNPIEVVGDHATMAYSPGNIAQLVREDGVWKVEDPD